MEGLNFLGDSWHLDPHSLWPSLVAGHSLGPLWVCWVFSWIFLLGRIPPSVSWVSWVLSVIGVSSWEIRNLGSHPSSLLVDPALSLSLAQLGTSALSLLHTKKKDNVFCICFFEGFASYPGYLPLILYYGTKSFSLLLCVFWGVCLEPSFVAFCHPSLRLAPCL